jgi:hypothetical protein
VGIDAAGHHDFSSGVHDPFGAIGGERPGRRHGDDFFALDCDVVCADVRRSDDAVAPND